MNMSNPVANPSELSPFQVVQFTIGKEKKEYVGVVLVDENNTPSKLVSMGHPPALQAFKDAVDTANTLVEAGKPANPEMIKEHPSIIKASEENQLAGFNPAIMKAALAATPSIYPENGKSQEEPAVPKNYVYNREDLPADVVKGVKAKLGDKAQVTPPIVDGKYKGKVVFENKDYVVQGVYKKVPEGYAIQNAVAHRKDSLSYLSENHQWRAENNRLGGQEIRAYYDGDKAKVYPYSLQKEIQERAAKTAGIDVKNMSPKARGETLEAKGVSTPPIPAAKQKSQPSSMER